MNQATENHALVPFEYKVTEPYDVFRTKVAPPRINSPSCGDIVILLAVAFPPSSTIDNNLFTKVFAEGKIISTVVVPVPVTASKVSVS